MFLLMQISVINLNCYHIIKISVKLLVLVSVIFFKLAEEIRKGKVLAYLASDDVLVRGIIEKCF